MKKIPKAPPCDSNRGELTSSSVVSKANPSASIKWDAYIHTYIHTLYIHTYCMDLVSFNSSFNFVVDLYFGNGRHVL